MRKPSPLRDNRDSPLLIANKDALPRVDAAALELFLFEAQAGQLEGPLQAMHRRSTLHHNHITAVTTNSHLPMEHLQCMELLKTRITTATAIKVTSAGSKVELNYNNLRVRIDRLEVVMLYTTSLPVLHLERWEMGSLDDAAHH